MSFGMMPVVNPAVSIRDPELDSGSRYCSCLDRILNQVQDDGMILICRYDRCKESA